MNRQASLTQRTCEIRGELHGECGRETLAAAWQSPTQTWLNYERGVTMPTAAAGGVTTPQFLFDVSSAGTHRLTGLSGKVQFRRGEGSSRAGG